MIDIEKFICSLLADHPEGVTVRGDIHKALKEQGLEYKDGKIVPIEDKTELKESEDERDERIRKWIINEIKIKHHNLDEKNVDFVDKAIAWLEKQDKSAEINPDEIIEECHQDNADHIIDIVTEQGKPSEWSKEDENGLGDALWAIKQARTVAKDENDMGTLWYAERWLKSIKDRIQSKQSSKPQGKSATEAIKKEKVDNANKVESKFKVGDWVVRKDGKNFHDSKTIQFTKTDENACQFGSIRRLYEDKIRHWTIADAQDGDVLVASDGSIFIFAGVVDCACKYYITLTATNDVKINKEEKGGYWETSRAVYPATKEQCALLFQKMREEGYEWDSESKELIKIE